jgi:hypothetical protein
MASKSIKEERHKKRKDNQDDTFKKRAETTVRNTVEHPSLFHLVVEARNENEQDQHKIKEMVRWFVRRQSNQW